MRVYHLLSEKYALDDMEKQRLKVSNFDDLNDPFELLSIDLSDRAIRRKFKGWTQDINQRYRILCFSRSWKNPVLWSHYGDKHKGICLGFDVPDVLLKEVHYTGERLLPTIKEVLQKGEPNQEIAERLLCTKFEHWKYEDEVRQLISIENAYKEDEHYFLKFNMNLELKEIIVGHRCTITRKHLKKLIKGISGNIEIIKARLAFTTFNVIKNKAGFRFS